MTNITSKNNYTFIVIDNKEYIEFKTNGKYKLNVLVDKRTWFSYLHKYSWTATIIHNKYYIKTSIHNTSRQIHRVIAENEFDEIDYFGRTIDHINGDSLDNRLCNLRCVSQIINTKNTTSKSTIGEYIYKNVRKNGVSYRVHMNIQNKTYHKTFRSVDEAIKYRDNVLIPLKEKESLKLLKKERDIEFERGLRDKLNNGEKEEVIAILKQYNVLK